MTIEDELRAVMHAHDAEAPTQLPWPVADGVVLVRRRPNARFALAVALVAVLIAGGTWLAVAWPRASHTSTPAMPSLTCPAERAPGVPTDDVPAAPTVAGAAEQLVPDETPVSVVVCGYRGDPLDAATVRTLTQAAVLTGDLAPIAVLHDRARVDGAGRSCTSDLQVTDEDDYLIGLSYPDGFVWVHAPGDHCAGASNGEFATDFHLAPLAATALAGGHWSESAAPPTPRPTSGSACELDEARLDRGAAMVPGSPTSLTICRNIGLVSHASVVAPDGLTYLVDALDALPTTTEPGRHGCGADVVFVLAFGYATGPGVDVVVADECTPSVDNGALQATATPALLDLVRSLSH